MNQEFDKRAVDRESAFVQLMKIIFKYYDMETKTFDDERMHRDMEDPEIAHEMKLVYNRFEREELGKKRISFPEVDNEYERIRSSLVRCLNNLNDDQEIEDDEVE